MADKVPKVLEVIAHAIEGRTDSVGQCPHCQKEIHFHGKAVFDAGNKLTFTINMKKGHKIQASTFGGTISQMDRLLRAAAKEMGHRVEVLINDVRVSGSEISVEYAICALEPGGTHGR